jgi:hypothetical protein
MAGLLDRLTAALNDRHTLERELGQGGMAPGSCRGLAQDLAMWYIYTTL